MEKKYQRSYLRPRLGPTLFHVIGITSRDVCRKILNHLGLPVYEVIASAPRGPPELDFFDQSPEYF
jgi:hypothetical protein